MLKKPLLFLATFLLSATLALPILTSPPPAQADALETLVNTSFPNHDKELKEFCNRRSGNQMNLETWYSGKCGGTFEESIGFSSIILLDFYERLAGQRKDDNTIFKIIDQIKNLQSNNQNNTSTSVDLAQLGIVGSIGNLITKTYSSPPASSTEYIAQIKQNLHDKKIIPEAIAADEGVGFIGLNPILNLWKAIRNIAYLFFVIIFIVMGFAIMFRVKINPQTVIGIQTILPKIIALLLLITFSYAIVGLLVDIMYLVFYLILNLMESNDIVNVDNIFIKMASGQWGLILSFFINGLVGGLVGVGSVISVLVGAPIIVGIGLNIGGLFIGGWILNLIVLLAILIAYTKTFFSLIKAYLGIILKLIFSPIILLGGVFPGSKTIGSWFRSLLADLSVFPTTMICLVIAYLFMMQGILGIVPGVIDSAQNAVFGTMEVTGQMIAPPIISLWGQDSKTILTLLGLGMLLMMNKYVEMIKEALQVPPFKHGVAIGENLNAGYWANSKWADKNYRGLPISARSKVKGRRLTRQLADYKPPVNPTTGRPD